MRHQCNRNRLGRPQDQRKALLRSLATELFLHGEIKTTISKIYVIEGTWGSGKTTLMKVALNNLLKEENNNIVFKYISLVNYKNDESLISVIIETISDSIENNIFDFKTRKYIKRIIEQVFQKKTGIYFYFNDDNNEISSFKNYINHYLEKNDIYLDIINQAKKYVHIMTPYLVLDYILMSALIHAAQRGVEVIIMMPHIPDKKLIYYLGRSYYADLIQNGVKIYEYTPGFVHAKMMVSDDEKAVVGSINLDYRSLYLHFECACFFYQSKSISQMESDFQQTLEKCQEIQLSDVSHYPLWKRAIGRILRFFAPLL